MYTQENISYVRFLFLSKHAQTWRTFLWGLITVRVISQCLQMAASHLSPRKVFKIHCFLCVSDALTYSFSLFGNKCIKDKTLHKLQDLITDKEDRKGLLDIGINCSFKICHSCHLKIHKCYELRNAIQHSVKNVGQQNSRYRLNSCKIVIEPFRKYCNTQVWQLSDFNNVHWKYQKLTNLVNSPKTGRVWKLPICSTEISVKVNKPAKYKIK